MIDASDRTDEVKMEDASHSAEKEIAPDADWPPFCKAMPIVESQYESAKHEEEIDPEISSIDDVPDRERGGLREFRIDAVDRNHQRSDSAQTGQPFGLDFVFRKPIASRGFRGSTPFARRCVETITDRPTKLLSSLPKQHGLRPCVSRLNRRIKRGLVSGADRSPARGGRGMSYWNQKIGFRREYRSSRKDRRPTWYDRWSQSGEGTFIAKTWTDSFQRLLDFSKTKQNGSYAGATDGLCRFLSITSA
jgi:hypothetical protein